MKDASEKEYRTNEANRIMSALIVHLRLCLNVRSKRADNYSVGL
jgi:hypothetical protein